jgi:hypothetical protein
MRPYNISAGLLSLSRVLVLRYFCVTRTDAVVRPSPHPRLPDLARYFWIGGRD